MSQRQRKVSYWQDAPMPRDQLVLFAESIDSRIPADHPVRLLDEILAQLDWNDWESHYRGNFGQPPIHPRILVAVLLFAMIRKVRSSRQIEYQIRHSIDFMWLVSGRTIDHATISDFRRKHTDSLKGVYRQLVQVAIDMKLAKLGELCIDGTRVLANSSRKKTWTAERIRKVLSALDEQITASLKELETNDSVDDLLGEDCGDTLPPELADMQVRREKLEAILEKLNAMDEVRKKQGKDPQKNPAQIPRTDPDARVLQNKEGGYAPNYTPMCVTETENAFIVGADVVAGNVEHTELFPMVEEIGETFDAEVETVMGDSAYSSGENLTAAEEADVNLLAPVADVKCAENPAIRANPTQLVADAELDKLPINPSSKCFDKTAFVYDESQDVYYCPAGKTLRNHGQKQKRTSAGKVTMQTVYLCDACTGCPLADRCRKNPTARRGRQLTHDAHEAARRRQRVKMQTEEVQSAFKQRNHIAELPFAVLKASMDLRRFLLRGLAGVQTEWLWGCTAYNMKKLINLLTTKGNSNAISPA